MRIYLDNAATTPVAPEVQEVMIAVMKNNFGNPSSVHAEGRKARTIVEKARRTVAKSISAATGEIFFTSGGTESHNTILNGAVRDLGVRRIITSPLEHPCILDTVKQLAATEPVEVDFVRMDGLGHVDISHLDTLLSQNDTKTLVSLMHSNNEIGTMIDLVEIAGICDKHNALFHTDTVQTIGYFPIDVSSTKIHFLAGSAHKFHGPKGVGFLYVNLNNKIRPFLHGGGQEREMRSGTENTIGIAGMAKALSLAVEEMEETKRHIESLKKYMIAQLQKYFDDILFNGDVLGRSHYKVLSVSFPESRRADTLVMNLDIAGISVSGGSACSSGIERGSHVLTAIGSPESRKTIRFSFSKYNTKEEIDAVIAELRRLL